MKDEEEKILADTILELKDISMVFNGEKILDRICLKIRDKEFITLLGPSGCGKTTTLRIIGGFLTPDEGEVFFNGNKINDLPPHKRPINTVFQRYALFPHLNVYENIAFGLKMQKLPKDEIDNRVEKMLRTVNLEGYGKRRVTQLSGGQQQRIAIARALVNYPKILLLDEPLGALDLKLRKEMQMELKAIQQQIDTTFIYVTHDQEEALTMSDTIVVMNEGEIQQIGTPQEIYNEPKNAFVADFIGESNIVNGIMRDDYKVQFAGSVFPCVDKGFDKNQRVDVVIRPEDIDLVKEDEAPLSGVIESVVFKGVHYEVEVLSQGMYWLIQTTDFAKEGDKVGLKIGPEDIHIMNKMFDASTNQLNGFVSAPEEITFLDVTFHRDGLNLEEGTQVRLNIDPRSISLVSEDHSDIVLYLESLIYKGAYNEMLFYLEEQDSYLMVYSENEEEVGTDLGLSFDFDQIKIEAIR